MLENLLSIKNQLLEKLKNNEEYKELKTIEAMIVKYGYNDKSNTIISSNSVVSNEREEVLRLIDDYLLETNNAYVELQKIIDMVRSNNLLLNTTRPGAVIGSYLRGGRDKYETDGKKRYRLKNFENYGTTSSSKDESGTD